MGALEIFVLLMKGGWGVAALFAAALIYERKSGEKTTSELRADLREANRQNRVALGQQVEDYKALVDLKHREIGLYETVLSRRGRGRGG
jgi:hypothetical protein